MFTLAYSGKRKEKERELKTKGGWNQPLKGKHEHTRTKAASGTFRRFQLQLQRGKEIKAEKARKKALAKANHQSKGKRHNNRHNNDADGDGRKAPENEAEFHEKTAPKKNEQKIHKFKTELRPGESFKSYSERISREKRMVLLSEAESLKSKSTKKKKYVGD